MNEKILIVIYLLLGVVSVYDLIKIISSQNYNRKWLIILNDMSIITCILLFIISQVASNDIDVNTVLLAKNYLKSIYI